MRILQSGNMEGMVVMPLDSQWKCTHNYYISQIEEHWDLVHIGGGELKCVQVFNVVLCMWGFIYIWVHFIWEAKHIVKDLWHKFSSNIPLHLVIGVLQSINTYLEKAVPRWQQCFVSTFSLSAPLDGSMCVLQYVGLEEIVCHNTPKHELWRGGLRASNMEVRKHEEPLPTLFSSYVAPPVPLDSISN